MTEDPCDILDDLFLSCALTAFLQVAVEQQAMPESEATKRRAYLLYEDALRKKNGPVRYPGADR